MLGQKQGIGQRGRFTETGIASWYGNKFGGHFNQTVAEYYDMYSMECRPQAFAAQLRARNTPENGKTVVVRVTIAALSIRNGSMIRLCCRL